MSPTPGRDLLDDAAWAAALVAADPVGLGGVHVLGPAGPVRDGWLAVLRALLPDAERLRRVPAQVSEGRLLGEVDLEASLRTGRAVAARGLLVECHGSLMVIPSAERMAARTAAHLARVLDERALTVERDGLSFRAEAGVGVIALDEAEGDDEPLPAALADRLALRVDLRSAARGTVDCPVTAADVLAARARIPKVRVSKSLVTELVRTAALLGIESLRTAVLAVRAMRVAAALDGAGRATAEHAARAARLVLGPRATTLPPAADSAAQASPPPPRDEPSPERTDDDTTVETPPEDADIVLAAALAAVPAALLASATNSTRPRGGRAPAGRAGRLVKGAARGRPRAVRRGVPGGPRRLALVDTLRAAAPWQRLRRPAGAPLGPPVAVRRDDLHVKELEQRTETTTIFAVDASGSAAMHRLAEVKGAIELLLADCYVRRDRVALIVFNRHGAQTVLAPTRSLVRAKRCLAGLPGGGATPLAAGLEAAALLAGQILRRGGTPTVVVLSDGRANVARDGSHDRVRAEADARAAAIRLRLSGAAVLYVDTAPRPQEAARALAAAMQARYMPLPHANARVLSRAAGDLAAG